MASNLTKGGIVVGGSALGAYGISELVKSGPTGDFQRVFLFNKADFGTSGSEYASDGGTFGYAFGWFLLDTSDKRNTEIWNKRGGDVDKFNNSNLSNEFQSVKNTDENHKDVNKVCEDVYKKKRSEVTEKLFSNAWRFCSIYGVKPATFVNNSTWRGLYKNKWAGNLSDIGILFDVFNLNEDSEWWVWNHILENILKKDRQISTNEFSEVFKKISSYSELRDVCSIAYYSAEKSDSDAYAKNVLNYCVLDKSVTLNKYPTAPSK